MHCGLANGHIKINIAVKFLCFVRPDEKFKR